MFYQVFLIESLGTPRNQHALFVEKNATDGSGSKFHVTGDIQRGMEYEFVLAPKPEEWLTFAIKSSLGWVDDEGYSRFESICRDVTPPKKQFDGPRRVNPGEPLRRCQKYTEEVVWALRGSGVLKIAGQSVPV